MITAPGIYDISEDEYHGNPAPEPCFSTGVCKDLINKSPKHAWANHPALNPDFQDERKDTFSIGTTGHALFLQGICKAYVAEYDSWRTKAAQEAKQEAYDKGLVPLLREQYDRVLEMVAEAKRALRESELGINDLQQEGISERSFFWKEGETWCKVRPDWIALDFSVQIHYKTTSTLANPDTVDRLVLSMGYDIAEAFYRRGVKAVTTKVARSVFFIQEVSPPYACVPVDISPQWKAMADDKVELGLSIWKQCMKKNEWPGYPTRVCTLDPPAWALAAWEMKQFALGLQLQEAI
jgi:hypothetical protein